MYNKIPLRFWFILLILAAVTLSCSQVTGSKPKQPASPTKVSAETNRAQAQNTPQAAKPAPTEAQAEQPAAPTMNPDKKAQPTATTAVKEDRPFAWKNNWLHFGVDSVFSSFVPNETILKPENVSKLRLLWGASCQDSVFTVISGTPAVYHGKMYVTYPGGKLEQDSLVLDRNYWGFGDNANAWAPPPVISSDGVIYYLYNNNPTSKLIAVDAETGQQIWEAASELTLGFNNSSQVTVDEANDRLYVVEDRSQSGKLIAINRKNGEFIFAIGESWASPDGPDFGGDIVLLKDNALYLHARVSDEHILLAHMVRVDPTAEKIDLVYDRPEGIDRSQDIIWYGMCGDYLYESYSRYNDKSAKLMTAHKLGDKAVVWKSEVPGMSGRLACDAQNNQIYVPTEQGMLAMDGTSGKVLWQYKTIKPVYAPTIANGVIYFLGDTNMYAISAADGSLLFRYKLGAEAEPNAGVLVNDGLVIFSGGGGDCDLYTLSLP